MGRHLRAESVGESLKRLRGRNTLYSYSKVSIRPTRFFSGSSNIANA